MPTLSTCIGGRGDSGANCAPTARRAGGISIGMRKGMSVGVSRKETRGCPTNPTQPPSKASAWCELLWCTFSFCVYLYVLPRTPSEANAWCQLLLCTFSSVYIIYSSSYRDPLYEVFPSHQLISWREVVSSDPHQPQ